MDGIKINEINKINRQLKELKDTTEIILNRQDAILDILNKLLTLSYKRGFVDNKKEFTCTEFWNLVENLKNKMI